MDASPSGITAIGVDLPLTKEKQEKALTLFCARAGHKCPQWGHFKGFRTTLFWTEEMKMTLILQKTPQYPVITRKQMTLISKERICSYERKETTHDLD